MTPLEQAREAAAEIERASQVVFKRMCCTPKYTAKRSRLADLHIALSSEAASIRKEAGI